MWPTVPTVFVFAQIWKEQRDEGTEKQTANFLLRRLSRGKDYFPEPKTVTGSFTLFRFYYRLSGNQIFLPYLYGSLALIRLLLKEIARDLLLLSRFLGFFLGHYWEESIFFAGKRFCESLIFPRKILREFNRGEGTWLITAQFQSPKETGLSLLWIYSKS